VIRSPVQRGSKRGVLSDHPVNTTSSESASTSEDVEAAAATSSKGVKKARVGVEKSVVQGEAQAPLSAQLVVERCEGHGNYIGTSVTVAKCDGKAGLVVGADEEECDISFVQDRFMSGR
jgi:hypothetical protein